MIVLLIGTAGFGSVLKFQADFLNGKRLLSHAALPDMDGDMQALARQTIRKLEAMTDADFEDMRFLFTYVDEDMKQTVTRHLIEEIPKFPLIGQKGEA